MKKILLGLIVVFSFMGCGENKVEPEDKKVYTEKQEKVFDVLDGSFQHVYVLVATKHKGGIYEFSRRYDNPIKFYGETYLNDKELAFTAHGEGRYIDITGTISFEFYYFVNETGLGLDIYKKSDKYSISESPYKKCTIRIENKDRFTLFFDSPLAGGGIESYERIK